MKKMHWKVAIGASLSIAILLTANEVPGQDSSYFSKVQQLPAVQQVEQFAKTLAPKGWTVPRTPDGQPDISGIYTNISLTPQARPKELGDKVLFTPEEAAAFEKNLVNNREKLRGEHGGNSADEIFGVGREYPADFLESPPKVSPTLQTSVIVDPPDGRMPDNTPEIKKKLAERAARVKALCADPTRNCPPGMDQKTPALADKPSDFTLMNRCIQWGTSGPPMMPSVYDSNYQIVQDKDYVMIFTETIHDARFIPLDGRPHLPESIRQLAGDSRGHWEGNTLVVDTTNFSDMTNFRNASRNLHVVERFTRVAPKVLLYEFSVDDPTAFTAPFTGIVSMTTIKGPIFEYACNEGNYALADIMRAARLEEKRKAQQSGGAPESRHSSNGGSGQQ